MEKKELFEKIKQLLEKLDYYKKTQNLFFDSIEEKVMLKDVFLQVYPMAANLPLTCPSCIIQYLNMLLAYHEREYPKYLAEQPVENIVQPKRSKGRKKKQ